jgi:hypothetical protein
MFSVMRSLITLILLASLAVSPLPQKNPPDAGRPSRDDDVRESVIRYQFKAINLVVAFHFISIDDKNPSDAFLLRFRDDDPPVRPISEARIIRKPIRSVIDRKTSKEGAIFRVGSIKWISDVKVDVAGGYECGDSCDEKSGVFHVSKQGDQWVVDSFAPAGKPTP